MRRAADVVRAAGADGFVSFECTPDLADDADATIDQALELWRRLDRDNVMIKVPATAAGIPAIEELTSRGVNVNVTLLFSLERYDRVIAAYLRGLARRAGRGEPIVGIRSVASFFVSRVDAKADLRLPPGSPLRGRVAIANAAAAYDLWRERFAGVVHPQRPLWEWSGRRTSTVWSHARGRSDRSPSTGRSTRPGSGRRSALRRAGTCAQGGGPAGGTGV